MDIAIDLGGTNVRIAGVWQQEPVEFLAREKFVLTHDLEKDFSRLIEVIRKIAAGEKVQAIGFGLPGDLQPDKKSLRRTTHLPEWEGFNFYERLKQEFDCGIYADNDAVVAAYGQASYDNLENQSFLYLTWGTGVGGARVRQVKGKIEVKIVGYKEYLWEFDAQCGGKAVAKKFKKSIQELAEDDWQLVMAEFEGYVRKLAAELMENKIVIGGGVAAKQKKRLEELAQRLKESNIDLKICNLGDEVGLYGGVALIRGKR